MHAPLGRLGLGLPEQVCPLKTCNALSEWRAWARRPRARAQGPAHPAVRAVRQVYVEEGAGEVWELDGVVWKSRPG